jgi:signal transduction histidine kinase
LISGAALRKPSAIVQLPAADTPRALPEDAVRLAKVAALALALTPLLEVARVLEVAGEHLPALLPEAKGIPAGRTRGYLLVWAHAERRLEHQALLGRPVPTQLAASTPPPERGLCALVMGDGSPRMALHPAELRAALAPWERALADGPDTAALIAAPLAAGPGLQGVLLLAASGELEVDDLRLVGAIALAVGGALARARAFGSVEREKMAGMGRLTAALAHEVNNPLQAISNSLHLLLNRSLPDDKRARYLTLAHKEVEQLIGLVRRILDFSRPERDGMRPVSVRAALQSVLAASAEQLQQSGIAVVCEWGDETPRVSGVASHLKQAFLNLVLATSEGMPAGGRLTVRTSTALADDCAGGQLAVIEIGDTGQRVPEDELRAIFEPFSRTRRDNSGVGLPVSYSIIEQHGGRLSVTSGEAGTTFRVELPALRVPS